jgi:hypothetical protein
VRLVDDRGRAMDAAYLVEADGGHLALIVESRSGSSGTRAPRNPDYNQALGVLLARLGMLNAVLADALVDSRHTQDLDLPEAERRLIQAPIQLALEPDPDALRRRLGTAQAKIAQAPDAAKGGNSTKRIRLGVDVPGFQPRDAARLAQTLAAPIAETSEKRAGYWRERGTGENVFMEITRREDIGTDLKAPAAARGGVVTASYVLVPLVQPGDVVIHYDSRQEAIVGVSVASSAAEPAPIYRVARGSYARRAAALAAGPVGRARPVPAARAAGHARRHPPAQGCAAGAAPAASSQRWRAAGLLPVDPVPGHAWHLPELPGQDAPGSYQLVSPASRHG